MVSLLFRLLVHFELIFPYGVKQGFLFNSLNIVFFNTLNTFIIIATLKSSSAKSKLNIWANSALVYNDSFFP